MWQLWGNMGPRPYVSVCVACHIYKTCIRHAEYTTTGEQSQPRFLICTNPREWSCRPITYSSPPEQYIQICGKFVELLEANQSCHMVLGEPRSLLVQASQSGFGGFDLILCKKNCNHLPDAELLCVFSFCFFFVTTKKQDSTHNNNQTT